MVSVEVAFLAMTSVLILAVQVVDIDVARLAVSVGVGADVVVGVVAIDPPLSVLRPPPILPLIQRLNRHLYTVQVNNILDARNKEMERNMAEKGVGFLAEAAKVEGSVQTARCEFGPYSVVP